MFIILLCGGGSGRPDPARAVWCPRRWPGEEYSRGDMPLSVTLGRPIISGKCYERRCWAWGPFFFLGLHAATVFDKCPACAFGACAYDPLP